VEAGTGHTYRDVKKAPFGAFSHQQLLEHLQVVAAFLATFLMRITRLLSRWALLGYYSISLALIFQYQIRN
jgi:hypothetical protein